MTSKNKFKLALVFADNFAEYNSSNYTFSVPANALRSIGYDISWIYVQDWMTNNARCKLACNETDIIIIQRVLLDESIKVATYWMSRGKKVYVSFDDAYQYIGEENAAFKFWGKGEVEVNTGGHKYVRTLDKHPVDQFRDGLKYVTGGITPSRVLCSDWNKFAPMKYLPNYIESHRYDIPHVKGSKLTVGWGGSLSHLTSFSRSGVERALHKFLSKHDDWQFGLVGDNRLIKQLGLPDDQLWFRHYVMFFDWPRILSSFDIGLAPLAMPYDQRRSRLKVMEYIAMGIPFVATKSEVYRDFFDCKSGIFVDQGILTTCDKSNEAGWLAALDKIAANLDDYRTIALCEKERYYDVYDNLSNAQHIAEVIGGK
jgi:glycosyltransferase involved in cell wall biosynthesis